MKQLIKETIRYLFVVLAKVNNIILPSYVDKDLAKLNKWDKIIIGYRYWVTKNSYKD